jgi:pyridinium-3,5-biscarboxylic acid mononucleotide sulfurtransferase
MNDDIYSIWRNRILQDMFMNMNEKYKKLTEKIQSFEKAAVAFSGGVDSSLLAKVCFDILGENAIAITLVSPMNPKSEIEDAKTIAESIGISHVLIEDDIIEGKVAENPVDRCYHCKKIEFASIREKAAELGFSIVLDGSNHDDLSDYRPGIKALSELSICSPLRDAQLTKKEIRELSKELGLKTWDKPALACLASRVPYGEPITKEVLSRIEKAEDYLRSLGFRQFRVRSHGTIARIEVSPEERVKMFDASVMDSVSRSLKSFGYIFVALELEGYKTGNMNKEISGK